MNEELRIQLATSNRNANAKRTTGQGRKGDDIADRLLALAAAVIRLLPSLSERPAARSIVKQLERCGPAGGANYEEARGAESPADFIHKVRIALKEVRETRYWLKLVLRAALLDCPDSLTQLINEATELIAILTASANTARQRSEQHGRG
ncbi:MAG: four helix bundle protein [Caldilineaceae bacterium]|jgi:four helix bundle protein